MFAGQEEPPVYRAEILVVLRASRLRPHAETAKGRRHAMPGHRYPCLKLFQSLRMNLRPIFERAAHALLGRKGGEFISVCAAWIGEQNSLGAVIAVARIAELANGQIGETDAAIDRLVLFPEAALELLAHFDRRRIGYRRNRFLHRRAGIDVDLAEDAQRNRAQ